MKQPVQFASVVLTLVVLTGCAQSIKPDAAIAPDPDPVVANPLLGQLQVSVLHKADYNLDDSQTTRSVMVFKTDAGYRTELARYSVEIPKSIDFNRQTVLLSTMGTQRSGGYVVSVVKADEYADEVVVTVESTSPGENCVTTSAMSNPYEFVVLDTVKVIKYFETAVTTNCGEE